MKPDRFEILVYLSGIAVAALITTAAFGMAVDKPPLGSGSNSGNGSALIVTSPTWSAPPGPAHAEMPIKYPRIIRF